jgi:hypothetical protein
MKHVKLEHGDEITITDEVHEQIKAIVEQHRICKVCRESYTSDRLMVSLNLCLRCFLRQQSRNLTYVGQLGEPNDYGNTTHSFLDSRGYIHTSYTGNDKSLEMMPSRILCTAQQRGSERRNVLMRAAI